MTERCCARIHSERFHTHQCSRNAVVERDGKHYCKQHDPVATSERRDASYKRYCAQWDERERAAAAQSAKLALADAVLAASEFRNGSLAGVNNTAVWDAIAAYRAATGEGR